MKTKTIYAAIEPVGGYEPDDYNASEAGRQLYNDINATYGNTNHAIARQLWSLGYRKQPVAMVDLDKVYDYIENSYGDETARSEVLIMLETAQNKKVNQ